MERFEMAMNNKAIVRYQKALSVHGYHIYNEIWEAASDETLVCMTEPGNSDDRNAVAVEKEGKVTGHLPRKVSWLCALFPKKGGTAHCTVSIMVVQFFV